MIMKHTISVYLDDGRIFKYEVGSDEKVREHSRKPDIVRKKIIDLVGDLPKIELFAVKYPNSLYFDGWDTWGNEAEGKREGK